MDNLKKISKGILFISNHTSFLDPIILFAFLWPHFKLRCLAIQFAFHLPVIGLCCRLVRNIPIPDPGLSINQYKIKKIQEAIDQVVEGLKEGDNILVFPTGKLKDSGKEHISGTSAISNILKSVPDSQIVLIRISGLWGSMFSKAQTGNSPKLNEICRDILKISLKNFIFFAPRRKIYLDFELNPKEMPRAEKSKINLFLEDWFNRYSDEKGNIFQSEPLKLVPYQFWSGTLPKAKPETSVKKKELSFERLEEIQELIISQIKKSLERPDLEISTHSLLGKDLGMDSLNIAEIVAFLFKKFSVNKVDFEKLETVQDLIDLAIIIPDAEPAESSHFCWPNESDRPTADFAGGSTIQEAFLNITDKMGNFSAIADDIVGPMGYKHCKKAVFVLAEKLRSIPEKNVGILLPSSVGSTLVYLALLFANKTPVMLNWTLGPRFLEHVVKITEVKTVISSMRFLDGVNFVDFGSVADQIVLIEDIRCDLSLITKLKGVFQTFRSNASILKKLDTQEDAICIILFTSGSESTPKGVPLSHKNILSNSKSCFDLVKDSLPKNGSFFLLLPQFHSFGFASTTTFLLNGYRFACFPNPTDSLGMAKAIEKWKASMIAIIPNFLKNLLDVANKEQLQSLVLINTAGDKTSETLYQRFSEILPQAELIEGYGLSETSPVISCGHPKTPKKGVGKLFPEVEVITINPETHQPLPQGTPGEICVRGPNVFNGYLGNTASPFIQIHEKSWFRTGDIGYVDSDQILYLKGRIKRFVKIGGEMINMTAIEEALTNEFRKKDLIQSHGPAIAICSEEKNDMQKIILFSTFPVKIDEVNELLSHAGFSQLFKITQVVLIDEIPLMSTGKINYVSLQKIL